MERQYLGGLAIIGTESSVEAVESKLVEPGAADAMRVRFDELAAQGENPAVITITDSTHADAEYQFRGVSARLNLPQISISII